MEQFVDYILGEADVPEAEWISSESNLKFARSRCWRETYFIDASVISDLKSYSRQTYYIDK